jgi:hypothetical protein
MNPNLDSMYGGVAGVRLGIEQFELGHGLVLKQTTAHFIAPFLMKFPASEPGVQHGKMSAVSDGISLKIETELFIPSSFNMTGFFDRLNTLWWITALMRLRGAYRAQMPVVSDRPFTEIAEHCKIARSFPVEIFPRQLPSATIIEELAVEDLQWLKNIWLPGGKLMANSSAFNDAFQALDGAGAMPTRAVATLAIWGAFEHLFSPSKQELRFRVSTNIATFLESAGVQRLRLQKDIMKLYDIRSSVAHGIKAPPKDAWLETFSLAHRVLNRILEIGRVPTKEDLENALFAPPLLIMS